MVEQANKHKEEIKHTMRKFNVFYKSVHNICSINCAVNYVRWKIRTDLRCNSLLLRLSAVLK